MRAIEHEVVEPAWNLACEEYFLTETEEDVFLLWRNRPSVIVGRNQNTLSEIDPAFVKNRGIPVVRRLTGGGAVFHDLGNVNFTFIEGSDGKLDWARFLHPVVEALRAMGLDAAASGRNDIEIGGKKVSGNAQTTRRGRVLHHGTLLYAADLGALSGALRAQPDKYAGRAVASVSARVGNIADFLEEAPDVEAFLAYLRGFLRERLRAEPRPVTGGERAGIDRLAREKYAADDWNYGGRGRYNFQGRCRTPYGGVEVLLDVRGGVIAGARFYGDFFGARDVAELEKNLLGRPHRPGAMSEFWVNQPIHDYFWGFSQEDLLAACL